MNPSPNPDGDSSNDAGSGRYLLCQVRRRCCALPIEQVIETMRPLPVEPIAGAPPFVDGLAIIRGQPVPVVAVARLFGDEASPAGRLVTVQVGERVVALAVDGVSGVRLIAPEALQTLPPLVQRALAERVEAIGLHDAGLLLTLQAARVVPEEAWDSWTRQFRDGVAATGGSQ